MAFGNLQGIEALNSVSMKQPTDIYIGDLLSCVMANIVEGSLWLTTQTNLNVIAIGHLHELSGIVFVEGMRPDEATIQKATECEIALFACEQSAYHLACAITNMGLTHVL